MPSDVIVRSLDKVKGNRSEVVYFLLLSCSMHLKHVLVVQVFIQILENRSPDWTM